MPTPNGNKATAALAIPDNEFRLGLTMAGAVSAGCYTGGVMDYLFELLDVWEKAKKSELPEFAALAAKIPRHNVVIEAMGGASAGGITTTISALYALNGNINPVRKPAAGAPQLFNNIFYDSWVIMDDLRKGHPGPTFNKIWETTDLADDTLKSLLNSAFVDRIADAAFPVPGETTLEEKVSKLPTYISKDLQLILSHTLLSGIPLSVDFQTPIARVGRKSTVPNHTTFEHYVISHYHLSQGKRPKSAEYLYLNPYEREAAQTLKLANIATAAFPVGLQYREFDKLYFNNDYLKTTFNRIISGKFGLARPEPAEDVQLNYFPKEFSSLTVDGGAINNEPYREVMSVLSDQYGIPGEASYPSYGVIMIDPFLDQAQLKEIPKKPKDLLDVIPAVLGTLEDQSRVKRREMLENDPDRYYRSIIFPRKWNKADSGKEPRKTKVVPDPLPIACASVGAFGGFFDISFRQHDFFLGRNNARNFFRYYFSMPYDKAANICHPIHADWTEEMVAAFKIEKDGKIFLPILPDIYQLLESEQEREEKRFQYDLPAKPAYDPAPLFESRPLIEKRILRIMEVLKIRKYGPEKTEEVPLTRELITAHYRSNLFTRAGSWFTSMVLRMVYFFGKRAVAKTLAKTVIQTILADLEKNGLLKSSG